MAFRTITARYSGSCYRCGGTIEPGDRIRFGNRRTYHLLADCPGADGGDMGGEGYGNGHVNPYAADRHAPVVITRNYRGEIIGTMNRNGPCEDRPCCGCCS